MKAAVGQKKTVRNGHALVSYTVLGRPGDEVPTLCLIASTGRGPEDFLHLAQALADRDPTIVLDELGASSINWSVRVWVAASDVLVAKDTLLVNAKKALDAAGVGIPFPQLDVHMIGTDAK